MPHRVLFDNILAQICGLGNLDKTDRERKMRQANRLYNRPQHMVTQDHARQFFNHNRAAAGIPPSPYAHHHPFIGDGLDPNLHTRRRRAEELGLYNPGRDPRVPGQRPLGPDVDDWSSEQIATYHHFHAENIERFKRLQERRPGVRLSPHSRKNWVRQYHEYIQHLFDQEEARMSLQGRGHGGRRMGPRGMYQRGMGYGEDDDDEDDDDD
jgi:hypothetical protein